MEAAGPRTAAASRVAGGLEEIGARSLAVLSGLAAAGEFPGGGIHLPSAGDAGGAHCRRLPGPGR
jgi:hypothetical protein